MLLGLGQVAFVDGRDELAQLRLVLGLDLGQGQHGGGLLVHNRAQARLALDDRIGDTHLAAQGGQEHHQLDRVHVVGDQHQSGFLVLDQSHYVVQAVFRCVWFLWLG